MKTVLAVRQFLVESIVHMFSAEFRNWKITTGFDCTGYVRNRFRGLVIGFIHLVQGNPVVVSIRRKCLGRRGVRTTCYRISERRTEKEREKE